MIYMYASLLIDQFKSSRHEYFDNACNQVKLFTEPHNYIKTTDSIMSKDGNYKGYLDETQLRRMCFRNDFINNKQYACRPFDDSYRYSHINNYQSIRNNNRPYCPNTFCPEDYFDFDLARYIVNPNDVEYKNYNCANDYHGYVNGVYF